MTVATLSHRRHLPALHNPRLPCTSSKQIFNPQSVFVHTVATRTFWKCRKTTVAVVVGLWDDCSCLLRECGIVGNTQRRAWSTLNCDCSLQRKAMFAASRAFESVTLLRWLHSHRLCFGSQTSPLTQLSTLFLQETTLVRATTTLLYKDLHFPTVNPTVLKTCAAPVDYVTIAHVRVCLVLRCIRYEMELHIIVLR